MQGITQVELFLKLDDCTCVPIWMCITMSGFGVHVLLTIHVLTPFFLTFAEGLLRDGIHSK